MCVAGKYKTVTGTDTCTNCSVNTYSAAVGLTTSPCQTCLNSQSPTASTICICNTGYSGLDGGTCTACVAGKYKPATGAGICTDCTAGKYSATTATEACDDCPLNSASEPGSSACQCNTDQELFTDSAYCPLAGQVRAYYTCLCCAGQERYFDPSPTQSNVGSWTCHACPVGKMQHTWSNLPCVDCVAGKYKSVTGASTCTNCDVNTYSANVGATLANTCESCEQNSQSPSGSVAFTNCICNLGYTGPKRRDVFSLHSWKI